MQELSNRHNSQFVELCIWWCYRSFNTKHFWIKLFGIFMYESELTYRSPSRNFKHELDPYWGFFFGWLYLAFWFEIWINYQLGAIEYLFVYFQLDMFRAYTPIFRSNGCYNIFTYAAYGVLGVVRCRSWGVCVLVACWTASRATRCICKEIVTSIAPDDGRISPKHDELKEHK